MMLRYFRALLGVALSLAWVNLGHAQSTINTAQPATNADLTSLTVRQQFQAAASDINGLTSKHPATSLSQCPSTPAPLEDCVTIGSAPYGWYLWTGAGGWGQIASVNPSTGVVSASVNSGSIVTDFPLTSSFSGGAATLGLAINSSLAVDGSNNLGINPTGNFSAGTITASLTGHASLDLAVSALGTNVAPALGNPLNGSGGLVAAFGPATYGAKCDGSTDDTTAFQNMSAAIVAAGGGTVEMPNAANCVIYNSGQSIANPLFQLNTPSPLGLASFRFHGNGSTFTVGHNFAPGELLVLFNVIENGNVWIDGINVTQTFPVNTGASSPLGTVVLAAGNTSGSAANDAFSLSLTNSTLTGGQTPFEVSNTRGAYLNNVQCLNCYYGIVGLDGLKGLTATNLYSSGAARDIFLKGVTNANISLTSINPKANAVLLSADVSNAILENIRINYKVFSRTAASSSPASYITIGPTTSLTNTVFRNFNINVDIDMSGDTAGIGSALKFLKNTTSALGTVFENIVFGGRIVGVPNFTGSSPVIDIFTAADAPWSGEAASNIVLRDLLVTGSVNPVFYIDYAPFPVSTNGGFVLENVLFPGNYTDANNGGVGTQRVAVNAEFANSLPVLNPSFGGTGWFQPTPHSLLMAEGPSAFNLLTAATAGNIIIDQGAGSDWLSKPVSGDVALSAAGVTAIGANKVTLAKLATQNGNTVLANATGGTFVPTAFAMPSCSTNTSLALQWLTNTGFQCATLSASDIGAGTLANGRYAAANLAAGNVNGGVTGTLPIANGGTGDTGTAWSQTVPTPVCSSGAMSGAAASSTVRVKTLGKTVLLSATAFLGGSMGTCAGSVTVALPFTPQSNSVAMMFDSSTGSTGYGAINAGTPTINLTCSGGGVACFAATNALVASAVVESQ